MYMVSGQAQLLCLRATFDTVPLFNLRAQNSSAQARKNYVTVEIQVKFFFMQAMGTTFKTTFVQFIKASKADMYDELTEGRNGL